MTCIRILCQLFGVKSSRRMISLKIFSDFFLRLIAAIFELFSSYSTAVFCFSFLEAVDSILDLSFCNFWDGIELIRHTFPDLGARLCFLLFFVFFAFFTLM